jgi:hypothetical protein
MSMRRRYFCSMLPEASRISSTAPLPSAAACVTAIFPGSARHDLERRAHRSQDSAVSNAFVSPGSSGADIDRVCLWRRIRYEAVLPSRALAYDGDELRRLSDLSETLNESPAVLGGSREVPVTAPTVKGARQVRLLCAGITVRCPRCIGRDDGNRVARSRCIRASQVCSMAPAFTMVM